MFPETPGKKTDLVDLVNTLGTIQPDESLDFKKKEILIRFLTFTRIRSKEYLNNLPKYTCTSTLIIMTLKEAGRDYMPRCTVLDDIYISHIYDSAGTHF